MGYKLILKPIVTLEIDNVISFYTLINFSIAQKLENEIRIGFDTISKYSEAFQHRYNTIRLFWIDKFPYGIYYIYENETVYVLAFWHEKEDLPKKISELS